MLEYPLSQYPYDLLALGQENKTMTLYPNRQEWSGGHSKGQEGSSSVCEHDCLQVWFVLSGHRIACLASSKPSSLQRSPSSIMFTSPFLQVRVCMIWQLSLLVGREKRTSGKSRSFLNNLCFSSVVHILNDLVSSELFIVTWLFCECFSHTLTVNYSQNLHSVWVCVCVCSHNWKCLSR